MSAVRDAIGRLVRSPPAEPGASELPVETVADPVAQARERLAAADGKLRANHNEQTLLRDQVATLNAQRVERMAAGEVDAVVAIDAELHRLEIAREVVYSRAIDLDVAMRVARDQLVLAECQAQWPAFLAARERLGAATAELMAAHDDYRRLQHAVGQWPLEPDLTIVNMYRLLLWASYAQPSAQAA
jgi:hypothetical protein